MEMRCACGGEVTVLKRDVVRTLDGGAGRLVLANVPHLICVDCGHLELPRAAQEHLDNLIARHRQTAAAGPPAVVALFR